jgi:predicted NBD/HSP70 family sugar kinase
LSEHNTSVPVAPPARARDARWRTSAELLARWRDEPQLTRAELARSLGLSSATATEVTARLRDAALVAEEPAPAQGRGRPTTLLRPHPAGPVVLAVELRQADWRVAAATLDGGVEVLEGARHASRAPRAVLGALRAAIGRAAAGVGSRLRAVSVSVAGTVREGRLVQAATLGWGEVDLAPLAPGPAALLVGNDATLSGVAEARSGAAAGAGTALHLLVEVGVGGTLVVDGRPQTGAAGAGGEFGHLPFGDRALHCPCGARGCWDLEVDGRALARRLGAPEPADPRSFARGVLARPERGARAAVEHVTAALAAGVAGLVNAHDPAVVTLGGLAAELRAAAPAAFDAAYASGLMAFRRAAPPPVLDAEHGEDGALHGAAAVGLDAITTEAELEAWAAGPAAGAG